MGARYANGWPGAILSLVFALGVAACGVFVSFDHYGATGYSVRGVASGLEGKKITLVLESQSPAARQELEVGEGSFVFPTPLAKGERFEVSVREGPAGLTCSVDMGTGTIAGREMSAVLVHCASSDALLADLTLSGLPLTPAFAPRVFDYAPQIRVFDVFTATPQSLTVTATTSHPAAVVTIAGVRTASGKPSAPMTLKFGPNRIVIVVVAPDQRQLHYTVLVNVKGYDYFKPADNTPPILLPPAGIPAPAFGTTVAISGDTMAVGSFRVVHVFRRSGKTWTQEALLQPDLAVENGGPVALTLALSGDTLVVGAPERGAAIVLRRSGTSWTQEAYLKASNGGALFGCSVALGGDTLAVGAVGESSMAAWVNGDQSDASMAEVGAVYVFTRTGSTWSQQANIKASNPEIIGRFGRAIALSGDTLVSTDSSTAYVFTRAGATWSQQATFTAPAVTGIRHVGTVALSGDTLAVSAPHESSGATGINGDQTDTSAANSGAVFVFKRSGSTWSQEAYVKASNTRNGAHFFGSSVALEGDTLAVSSDFEDSGAMGIDGDQTSMSSPAAGAVYRFVRSGTSWSQQAYVKASNTRPEGAFGASLALSGAMLVVGAPGDRSTATGINGDETVDPSNPKLGAAYVF